MTTPPIGPIAGITPLPTLNAANNVAAHGVSASGAAGNAASSRAAEQVGGTPGDFSAAMLHGIEAVSASQHQANELAVRAATGRLDNPAQLTIATTKAQLMTQLATTIESKAVNAFKTIMSMRA